MGTLSPRLKAVAAHVLPGRPMADIGTDHAYLPVALVQADVVPRAIAGDHLPGPLQAACRTVAAAALSDRITLRMGSGLSILTPGEVATATICGMGGGLITSILVAGPLEGLERLVLQPMGDAERLRGWLAGSGWRLTAEQLVEDGGRIYLVIRAAPGVMSLSEVELLIGPHLLQSRSPLLARYASMLLAQAIRAREGVRRSERIDQQERLSSLTKRILLLEEVVAYAESYLR